MCPLPGAHPPSERVGSSLAEGASETLGRGGSTADEQPRQKGGFAEDADADAGPRGQRRAGDETLDGAGGQEDDDQAGDDRQRSPSLLGQRGAPGAVTGVDERPPQPQSGAAGDEDSRELEQAVRKDQAPELELLAHRREQP